VLENKPTIRISRSHFLLSLSALFGARKAARASTREPAFKALLVVAHPDDEYAFAATAYRMIRELGGAADQVVITNGEGGFRYSQLASVYYGAALTNEATGRRMLPEIRRKEAEAAGRIIGIRRHYFLDQKDARFTLDDGEAARIWNTRVVTQFLTGLLERERHDFVFVLLPTEDTHGHHREAARLALDAAQALSEDRRPAILGAEPGRSAGPSRVFGGRTADFACDRRRSFGPDGRLNYGIIANWVIAEHKSQGLFQTEKHELERYWLLDEGAQHGRATRLFERLGA
jgi:LmbE family N-acetylglucosaminyl deacetylase